MYSSVMIMKLSMFSGENLQSLLKEVDYYVEVMNQLNQKRMMPYLLHYRETISTIIDKGHCTGSHSNTIGLCKGDSACAVDDQRQEEDMFINRVLQSFWCGHAQRCHHYTKKTSELQSVGQYYKLMMSFYSALNSFRGVHNNNGNGSQFRKVRGSQFPKVEDTFEDAMAVLKPAAKLSPWNFQNKVHLLEAEMFSFEKRYDEARTSYAAAITSSCASRFVHEQGLSFELSGLHCKKIGDSHTALDLLQRAKTCYQQWGSQMKVESINQQIEKVNIFCNQGPT